jgi:hypothetical protein
VLSWEAECSLSLTCVRGCGDDDDDEEEEELVGCVVLGVL